VLAEGMRSVLVKNIPQKLVRVVTVMRVVPRPGRVVIAVVVMRALSRAAKVVSRFEWVHQSGIV
jgi:hypothetical protein